jgi:hypothetical protein
VKTLATTLFWLFSLLTAVGRFIVPGHGLSWAGTYEAFAHLWVGGLLGVWWVRREPVYLWVVGALTVLETVMFLLR